MRTATLAAALPLCLLAADSIALPPPQTSGGRPLMQALKARSSARDFKPDPLPEQMLSNLLWAAFGVNRSDGKRTAPSPHNRQEIDIYVTLAAGAYRYDAAKHTLVPVADGDLRGITGTQDFVATAPVNLVYVADLAKLDGGDDEKLQWSGADTGFIGQNVYLFCASEGLATVIRGSFDRAALNKSLNLRPAQRVVLTQSVGYPKSPAP
jgi:SagB-type dehydrogenase family enzyme